MLSFEDLDSFIPVGGPTGITCMALYAMLFILPSLADQLWYGAAVPPVITRIQRAGGGTLCQKTILFRY